MLRNGTPSLQARAAIPEIWCSRPDTSAQAEQHPTQTAMQQECYNTHVCVLQAFEGVCHADEMAPLCCRPERRLLRYGAAAQTPLLWQRSRPRRLPCSRSAITFMCVYCKHLRACVMLKIMAPRCCRPGRRLLRYGAAAQTPLLWQCSRPPRLPCSRSGLSALPLCAQRLYGSRSSFRIGASSNSTAASCRQVLHASLHIPAMTRKAKQSSLLLSFGICY